MATADDSGKSAALPALGTVLAGRYLLKQRIAAGGMGAVYRAEDRSTHRRVALKVLHPEYASDAEVRRRFRRESSVLAALDHPGIVRILDFGTDDKERCYTVMELLEGETLQARIARDGTLSPPALVPIVDGIASALSAVHAHGVIHGDLKPANIFLLTESGEVSTQIKLVDFGLSKVLGLDRLTRTGEVIGTPAYMAPELLTGDGAIDGRVDTYSLGVIVYEALSGRMPFTERNPGKLLFDIVMGKATPIVEAVPGLSPAIVEIISRAMSPARENRFEGADELAGSFRREALGQA